AGLLPTGHSLRPDQRFRTDRPPRDEVAKLRIGIGSLLLAFDRKKPGSVGHLVPLFFCFRPPECALWWTSLAPVQGAANGAQAFSYGMQIFCANCPEKCQSRARPPTIPEYSERQNIPRKPSGHETRRCDHQAFQT